MTIIVAIILAKFTFKGIKAVKAVFSGVKEGVLQAKEYLNAINELDNLYKKKNNKWKRWKDNNWSLPWFNYFSSKR